MAPSKKTMIFLCLLVAAVAVGVPVAQGQILGSTVVNINGTLFCSANLSTNGTSPPLANATVELRCGAGNGTLVASVRTNNSGMFSILLNRLSINIITQLLSGQCRVVVATPIVGCNATVPTGILSSPVVFVGNIISGLFTFLNFILGGFTVGA